MAICGGAPYIWKVEPVEPRWCFGERRRQPGRWELRAGWEKGKDDPDDPACWWEPVWVYRCDGCGKDRALFPGHEWVYVEA